MGALMRAIDRRHSPLGALSEWPQSLRTTMSICLNSKFPIAVYWGSEFLAGMPVLISTSAPERAPRNVPVLAKPIGIDVLCGWMRRSCRCGA